MTKQVVIIGVGGYSANLVDIMRDINATSGEDIWTPIGYLDDDSSRQGTTYYDLPVLGTIADAGKFPEAFFINAVGSTRTASQKPELISRTGVPHERFAILIHPTAFISPTARIGVGSVIAQQCVVMSNSEIGKHVKTLPLSTVSYGCNIGDFSTIAGGAVLASDVRVGTCSYIGANASIRERISIGTNAVVGMGSAVVKNVPNGVTVVGVPARPISS